MFNSFSVLCSSIGNNKSLRTLSYLKARAMAKNYGPKDKWLQTKAKAKNTALCPRDGSKTRTSPREHVTVGDCRWRSCKDSVWYITLLLVLGCAECIDIISMYVL